MLEDPHPLAFRDTGETLCQLRWMDGSGFGSEKRTQGEGAAQPLAGLRTIEDAPVVDADSCRRRESDLDIPCVSFREGEHELPDARELGVDGLCLEKRLHLVEILAGELRQAAGFVLAEVADREVVGVVEGLADLAGVPARGAVGDALALEEDDLLLRRELLEEQRRPQAGEAAADDGDIGALLAGERRARGPRRQVGEPVAARFDRPQRIRRPLRDDAPRRPRPSTRRALRRTCRAADS
jgi:hypothetical protein